MTNLEVFKAWDKNPSKVFINQRGEKAYISNGEAITERKQDGYSLDFGDTWQEITYCLAAPNTNSFTRAINSNKKVKHNSWEKFLPIPSAIKKLSKNFASDIIKLINEEWEIEK